MSIFEVIFTSLYSFVFTIAICLTFLYSSRYGQRRQDKRIKKQCDEMMWNLIENRFFEPHQVYGIHNFYDNRMPPEEIYKVLKTVAKKNNVEVTALAKTVTGVNHILVSDMKTYNDKLNFLKLDDAVTVLKENLDLNSVASILNANLTIEALIENKGFPVEWIIGLYAGQEVQ